MKPAIIVDNISKQYRIGLAQRHHDTLRDALIDGMRHLPLLGEKRESQVETIWALKDVSFEVQPGEVLGVIGRNGAGKSTLLKILSRITEPTSGRAVINGRVGSLLEVGTGFHPELTGRENIFLNGAILGMRRREIERKFDEIVAFSEIEKFLDTPVKRYSSGMYVRLAFAVAAHLEPEVLLVDEVLAVGDAAFQKKCLGKMGAISNEGRTVIFVSHNLIALRNLCQSALHIKEGRLVDFGAASKVASRYLLSINGDQIQNELAWNGDIETPGNAWIKISKIAIRSENKDHPNLLYQDQGIQIWIDFSILQACESVEFILKFYTVDETMAFDTSTRYDPELGAAPYSEGTYQIRCTIVANLLNAGAFSMHSIARANQINEFEVQQNLKFEVIDSGANRQFWYGKRRGIFAPETPWALEKLD